MATRETGGQTKPFYPVNTQKISPYRYLNTGRFGGYVLRKAVVSEPWVHFTAFVQLREPAHHLRSSFKRAHVPSRAVP